MVLWNTSEEHKIMSDTHGECADGIQANRWFLLLGTTWLYMGVVRSHLDDLV